MTDINSINVIVKILEIHEKKNLKNNISVIRFRVQFPQMNNNCIMHLIFWGSLANNVRSYHKINDYVLIEGYIRINETQLLKGLNSNSKKMEIIVLKIYPFLLNLDRSLGYAPVA